MISAYLGNDRWYISVIMVKHHGSGEAAPSKHQSLDLQSGVGLMNDNSRRSRTHPKIAVFERDLCK